jgi:hypothetical protein
MKAHKSQHANDFGFAALSVACVLFAGCESAPKAEPSPAATPVADAAKAPSRPGPTRIAPKRAAAAASPAPDPDPTAALMNPGDELEPEPAPRAPARARAAAPAAATSSPAASATAPAPIAPSGATPPAGRRTATDAERAAAARMAAESAARRQAAADARRQAAAAAESGDGGAWSIYLASFTGDDHREAARLSRDEIARRYPALTDAFVSSGARGSSVLAGRFAGPEDPAAKARLKAVKEMLEGGARVFPRAMLTRTATDVDQGPPGPNDLRIVRQRFPKAQVYSVQVAAWSTFGSKDLKYADMKRAAEAYCRELRSRGEEAYYFHDSYSQISTVMVGVYGPDAYDSKSTLHSAEVDAVMRRFPKSLVNGEEVLIPLDPSNPQGKTVPQGPRLVEIPRM